MKNDALASKRQRIWDNIITGKWRCDNHIFNS